MIGPIKENSMYSRLNMTPASIPVFTLLNNVRNVRSQGLDLSPDYQRGYIWSNEYKDQLIISIILNYPIGNIVVNNLATPNNKNANQELVDGKQRISTILRFVEAGKVHESILDSDDTWYKLSAKSSDMAKQIIEKIIGDAADEEVIKMKKVRRLSFSDFPESIQSFFMGYNIPLYTMQSADPAQIRDYFKVLQNQEKLRAGEIINSLPDNPLLPFFKNLSPDFLEKINYENLKRADLEKTYYSLAGLWFSKIQINGGDAKIIDFVDNLKNITPDQVSSMETMNANLNYIANMSTNVSRYKISKRTLKLIMGAAISRENFFKDETLSKVEYICSASAKLAAFNSSESDDNAYTKYFGDEYSEDKEAFISGPAIKYRKLYTATARSTTKADFEKAIDILEELVLKNINKSI